MTTKIITFDGLRPIVPAGADPARMVLAQGRGGVLGSLNTQTQAFVPAVARNPMVGTPVPAGMSMPLLPLLGVVQVGLGIFNGVMSWKMNNKLNHLLGQQEMMHNQMELGFQALLQAQEQHFTEMRAAFAQVEHRLDLLQTHLAQIDLRQIRMMQNKVLLTVQDFASAKTRFDAEQVLQVARDQVAFLDAHGDAAGSTAEALYPFVLAQVQALVASADARFFLAQQSDHDREGHLAASASLRAKARRRVAQAAKVAAQQSMWDARATDVPLVVMYWHLAQGLDATPVDAYSVAGETVVQEVAWQDQPWRQLQKVLTSAQVEDMEPQSLLEPQNWDEWNEWRRLQRQFDASPQAVRARDVSHLLDVPQDMPLAENSARRALELVGPAWIDIAADAAGKQPQQPLSLVATGGTAFTEYDVDQLTSSMHTRLGSRPDSSVQAQTRQWALDARTCLEDASPTRVRIETDAARAALFGAKRSDIDATAELALTRGRSAPDLEVSLAALHCIAALNVGKSEMRPAARTLIDAAVRDPGLRHAARILWKSPAEVAEDCRRTVRAGLWEATREDPGAARDEWRRWRTASEGPLDKEEAAFGVAYCDFQLGAHTFQSRQEMRKRRRRYADLPLTDQQVIVLMREAAFECN